jgi:hypothetical protein
MFYTAQCNVFYSDFVVVRCSAVYCVNAFYTALHTLGEAAKVGLKINEQKTKYMIAARNDTTIQDVGQSMAIGDKHFEVVKEFVYLGSLMTPMNEEGSPNNMRPKNRKLLSTGECTTTNSIKSLTARMP